MTETIDAALSPIAKIDAFLVRLKCKSDATIVNGRHVDIGWRNAPYVKATHVKAITRDCVRCDATGRRFPAFSRECPCITYQGAADGINHAIDDPPLGLDMCKSCYHFGHQDDCHCTDGRVAALTFSALIVASQESGFYEALANAVANRMQTGPVTIEEIEEAAKRALADAVLAEGAG